MSYAAQHAMSPEFGRKWGTDCLNTKFPPPTLLYAVYSVKLISPYFISRCIPQIAPTIDSAKGMGSIVIEDTFGPIFKILSVVWRNQCYAVFLPERGNGNNSTKEWESNSNSLTLSLISLKVKSQLSILFNNTEIQSLKHYKKKL